jgi:arabinofuranosyltransferase
MAGRFFTGPYLAMVICLGMLDLPNRIIWMNSKSIVSTLLIICLFLIAVQFPNFIMLSSPLGPSPNGNNQIVDQQAVYAPSTSLLNFIKYGKMLHWRDIGLDLRQSRDDYFRSDPIGFIGYYAGPRIYIHDEYSLADPLRARLPISTPQPIGHYSRHYPQGYVSTIQHGFQENRIENKNLKEYYDHMLLITQGTELFSSERLQTILNFNLGKYDYLLEAYLNEAPEDWQ